MADTFDQGAVDLQREQAEAAAAAARGEDAALKTRFYMGISEAIWGQSGRNGRGVSSAGC
jgi:hypothetical protein